MTTEAAGLFDLELPEGIAQAVRKVEAYAGQPIRARKSKKADVSHVVGYFSDEGVPEVVCGPGGKPTLEEVSLEVLRLEQRELATERRMPYSEMRHESNQRLCRRLYRIMEQEVLLAMASSHGVTARAHLRDSLLTSFLEPLEGGSYAEGTQDPERTRVGALDGLELLVAYVDDKEAKRVLERIANASDAIAGKLGYLLQVVANHRPFDDQRRVRAAYYLAVPFLFDTRRPTQNVKRFR